MSKLPPGWTLTELSCVADWGSGGTPSRSRADYYGGGIPWIKTGELGQGLITQTEETITELGLQNSSAKMFPKGSVAVAMYGATIGKVATLGIDAATNQACAVGVPRYEAISGEYLLHYLASQKQSFIDAGKGGAQPNISQALIKAWPIPLAPRNEQKRIADKLDAVLARVDACRERLDRIPAILKRFRQSVLAAATSGKLTEEWRAENKSAEWGATQLRDISELITKGASPKWQGISYVDEGKGGTLFVTSENVRDMALDVSSPKFVESSFDTAQRRSVLKKGDLLTNIVGASIGRTAIYDLDQQANINQAVCLIRLKPEIDRRFVLYSMCAPNTLGFMHTEKVDVARANLSLQDIGNIKLRMPEPREQAEVVRRVEALFACADAIESRYTTARAQVERLTPALLAKTFRGELVPQDPNDEPASMLLERVGASKQQTDRSSKTRVVARKQKEPA